MTLDETIAEALARTEMAQWAAPYQLRNIATAVRRAVCGWLREDEGAREAMARVEHEHLEQFGSPGERHPCPPSIHEIHARQGDDCDGWWTEAEYPSWEDEAENIKLMHRNDADRALAALLSYMEGTDTKEGTDA